MGKKKSSKKSANESTEPDGQPRTKMPRKEYEAEMAVLQGELVAMQEWVKSTGAKICIVFEGRDTAGKGGTIKRIVERVSPGSSGWWPSPHRPTGRSPRCTSSAIWRTSRRPAKWSSSTAAGTTGRAWSA
ncbi:hypothetical protein PJ267_18840 [Arthrobacter sp. OVS8]|nr:hypothetical protein PJ267_18840 [Arthrobacter sp. OVS8]